MNIEKLKALQQKYLFDMAFVKMHINSTYGVYSRTSNVHETFESYWEIKKKYQRVSKLIHIFSESK